MKKVPSLRFPGFEGEWEEVKIKDLGRIEIGNTPSTSIHEYYSQDGLMFITSKDIKSDLITNSEKKLSQKGKQLVTIVPKNTLLVTCYANIGKNCLTTTECAFNQSIIGLIPKATNDPYFLLSISYQWSRKILKIGNGTTFKGINKEDFSNLKTYIPPFQHTQEQSYIASFLILIDRKIEIIKQQKEKIIQIKKYLLNKMFVND